MAHPFNTGRKPNGLTSSSLRVGLTARVSMKHRQLTSVQTIALGFFLVIMAGTLLLMLPVSSADGTATGFIPSLFTATSASCVTGLVMVDTGTHWSFFGQAVVLVLIQIGGLGFMTIATLFSKLLKRRMSMHERGVMAASISSSGIGRITEITGTIGWGTLLFEGVGALLLCIRFIPERGFWEGLWFGIFHSVTAFCNAGFDIIGNYASLTAYYDDALVCVTIMALITIGGLGFLVWDDIKRNKLNWRRYELQTKLVLLTSLILTVGGAVLFFFLERNRMNADMTFGEQVLVSFFSSVTPRTAGYNSVDTAALSPGSKLLTIILMFIGGSSGSTAGGIKTTTIAVLAVCLLSAARGKRDPEIFGRRISNDNVRQAGIMVFMNLSLALTGALLICLAQDFELTDVLFEVFSAMGTVGMTTGITRDLNDFSAVVITILMYLGRVGSLSFAMALLERRAHARVRCPEEPVTIG